MFATKNQEHTISVSNNSNENLEDYLVYNSPHRKHRVARIDIRAIFYKYANESTQFINEYDKSQLAEVMNDGEF